MKKSRDPNGVGFDAVYDLLGRATSQTDTVGDVTSTSYDKAGNVKTQTDAKNKVTTTVYDVLGRTKGVTDRLTNETLYAYDLAGRMTSITDAQGKTTSYAFNALGAKTEETYPDHTGGNSGDATYGKVKFTYDPAGRMIRREDQKGDTVTFNHTTKKRCRNSFVHSTRRASSSQKSCDTFFSAGTITSRDYRTKANSPSGTIADSDTFTFDNLGRMLTAVSGRYTNTVTMTYDSYGRLKDESLTLASQTYTVTRAYDTRSRLTQLTYPNGSIVQRTYTTRSQLHTVKYLGTTVDTRTYDDGGRLGTSTYANAAVVSFAYRNDNLPTSIATTHAGSPNIGTYSYTWDANKNKTGETITSTMSGFGFSTGATGYDDEDRLQTWNRTNGTMNQAWTLSDVGNWDAFTSAGSTWNRTHSNAHEFTGFTGASTGTLTYDVKGNQTSRPSTLSAPALNLDWNFDNQLVGADTNGSAGSLEVTFEYDALGRRVSRSHSSGNVVYVHAGQQVIADYARGTAAASPSYRYVYADYVDEPILRHTGTGTTLPTTGDNALYYHRNQQYSIIGLTNAAGTLVERYSYTAYGTLGIYDASGTVRTTSTYANRYTYTGREYDPDLNLYHFRARWYDPSTGGFISRDPLGYVDGMSLYRGYFGVKRLDPNGSFSVVQDQTSGSGGIVSVSIPEEDQVVATLGFDYVYERPDGTCYMLTPEIILDGETISSVGRRDVACPRRSTVLLSDRTSNLAVRISKTWKFKEIYGIDEHYWCSKDDTEFSRVWTGSNYVRCVEDLTILGHGDGGCSAWIDANRWIDLLSDIMFCRPCTIWLNSCQSGLGSNPIAQRIANATGCVVNGTKGFIAGYRDGIMGFDKYDRTGSVGEPDYSGMDTWKQFVPIQEPRSSPPPRVLFSAPISFERKPCPRRCY